VVHEWALAEAIVKSVYELVADKPGRVEEVCVVIGELQNIEQDVLRWALVEISKGTELEGVEFKLEIEEAEFKCRTCGYEWNLSGTSLSEDEREAIHFIPEVVHSFLKCPNCGSPDFKVVRGRGVWIRYVRISRVNRDGS